MSNRRKFRELYNTIKKELKKHSISKFQNKIREYLFVDSDDNLIVEMVCVSEYKYIETKKIKVKDITTFHSIYELTDSVFNNDVKPSVYVRTEVSMDLIKIDDKMGLLFPTIDKGDFQKMYSEDRMMSYSLDSKLIRGFLGKKLGYRSGYDRYSKWNDLTEYFHYKFLNSLESKGEISEYFNTIQKVIPFNMRGDFEVPLGKCIIT